MPSLRSLLVVLLAAVPLAPPAAAAAEPPTRAIRRSFSIEAVLPRQDGYRLEISTRGQHQVSIVAERRGTHVTYDVRGHVSRDRIAADFGRFGKVDVRFNGRAWKTEAGYAACRGHEPVTRHGSLRGTIRVHGGRRFVDVTAHHARATMTRVLPMACPFGTEPPARPAAEPWPAGLSRRSVIGSRGRSEKEEAEETALLIASSREHGRRVEFLAIELFGAPLLAGASVREQVGRVGVTEGTLPSNLRGVKIGKPDAEPETAAVALPPPFSGKATYTRESSRAPSWTGSLRVRLPGSGVVPLTGEGFHPRLCYPLADHQLASCPNL